MEELSVFDKHIAIAEDIIRRSPNKADRNNDDISVEGVGEEEVFEWYASVKRLIEKIFGSECTELQKWNEIMNLRSKLLESRESFSIKSHIEMHMIHFRVCIIFLTELEVIYRINHLSQTS